MFDWLKYLLDTSNFPQRWFCGEWSKPLGWTHIIADVATFAAYMMIPFIMMFFIKRRGMRFPTVFSLFAAFIFSCGLVHLVEATIFWQPWYRLSALLKVVTAVVSWATVIAIIPIFPQLLALRKPADLLLAEERFRILLESAPDAMVIVDSTGLITLINKQTENIFGYDREDLDGKPVQHLIPGYSLNRMVENDFSAGVVEVEDLMGKQSSGVRFPVEMRLSLIKEAQSTSYCCAIRDVSEKTIAQEQLVRSERLTAVGQAMTGLVHESRNALARSQAALKLLDRELEDQPEANRYIAEALQAQKDVQRLFEEVRLYAAPSVITLGSYDVAKLVSKTWKNLEPLTVDREVSLKKVMIGDVECRCDIDAFLIGGAIRNLMENALAACDDPCELTVSYRQTDLEGAPALEIRFKDNGPVHELDLEKMFEAFYTTKVQGTGLGLAIARRSLEEHGGKLTAERAESGALEFIMVIPK